MDRPYTEKVIVKFMQDGTQVAMTNIDANGVAKKDLPKGDYTFDSEGRIVFENKLVEENGGLYYYVNGVLTAAGLIELDGDYYYIRSNGQAAVGSYYVTRPNGLMETGYYEFGTDGKMIIEKEEEKKNGLVEENGGLFYYVDGVLTAAGLIELDGDYYYIRSNSQAAVGKYYVTRPNGLMEAGYYEFGADGKMILG
jgi:glucan-binding YG repeat protein